jgi:hypothetical protein
MVEDKWNARGKGRREQRTHQPTGGRGAQGGLRIGEMERDAILGHGISAFVNESYMVRSDGASFRVCKGCGTIPIENPKTGLFICPLCTGPVSYIGSGAQDLEIIPPIRKTMVAPVIIEMPYAFKLLSQEMETYMNISMRIMTEKDLLQLNGVAKSDLPEYTDGKGPREGIVLQERVLPEAAVPEYREIEEGPTEASPELLMKLGAIPRVTPTVTDGDSIVLDATGYGGTAINIAAQAAATLQSPTVPGSLVQTERGPMFQPNPTTVTVVPPARSIQVMPGDASAVEADEELGGEQVNATNTIPQTAPMAPMAPMMNQPPMMTQQPMMMPMMTPQYGYPGYPQQAYPQYNLSPYPGVNMGPGSTVYASQTAQPAQPAQMFTSGVPGAPPTFAIQTDPTSMSQFAQPQGPKPKKSFTLKKGRVGFAPGAGESEGQQSGGANVTVTVSKMG